MADWKTTVRIGDLHAARKRGEMTIREVGEKVAARLERNRYAGDLKRVISRLRRIRSVEAYDACLEKLYNFADVGHRIWIDSSERR